ncbi:MAG: hypothetical protein WCO45_00525 [Pseudanabaena sp. ELA607]
MNRTNVIPAVMRQTVRSFWQNINWDNRPLMNPPPSQGNDEVVGALLTADLSFAMSVKDYFVAVSWEGTPEIGVIPNGGDSHRHESKLGNDATLDDFLEDLSKFF